MITRGTGQAEKECRIAAGRVRPGPAPLERSCGEAAISWGGQRSTCDCRFWSDRARTGRVAGRPESVRGGRPVSGWARRVRWARSLGGGRQMVWRSL